MIKRAIFIVCILSILMLVVYVKIPEPSTQPTFQESEDVKKVDLDFLYVVKNGDEFPLELIQENKTNPISDIVERKIELTIKRVISDRFGNIDEKILNNNLQKPLSLLVEKGSNVPKEGTIIGITLTTIIKENTTFETAGKYRIFINDAIYLDESFSSIGKSDNVGKITIAEIKNNLSDLLKNKPNGIYKIKYDVSQFYVIEKKNIYEGNDERFYLESPLVIYESEFEVSDFETIIKNESGDLIRIYNIDIPFVFSHSGINVPQQSHCVLRDKTGCYSYAYIDRYLPPESAPFSKLVEKTTEKIIGSGTSFSINIQRNTEYVFYYGEIKKVEFKTPEFLKAYEFVCVPNVVTQVINARLGSYYYYTDHKVNCNF